MRLRKTAAGVLSLFLAASAIAQTPNLGKVQSVTIAPATVVGGTNTTGTVHLDRTAFPDSVPVRLTSNNSAARVNVSVSVPAGSNTATFTITTIGVAAPISVSITADGGGAQDSAAMTINPASLSSVALSLSEIVGGRPVSGTVRLTGQAPPSGSIVALSSDDSAVDVPATVTIAGGQNNVTFPIPTRNVSNASTVTITASHNSVSRTASLSLIPIEIQSLTLSSPTLSPGQPITATVRLNGPVSSAAGLSLRKSATPDTAVDFRGTTAVPFNQDNVSFPIEAAPVASRTDTTITVDLNGRSPRSAQLAVNAPVLTDVFVSVPLFTDHFPGGLTNGHLDIRLSGRPAAGYTIKVSTDSPLVNLNREISPTANNAQVFIDAQPVSANTDVVVKVEAGGVTKSVKFTLVPPVAKLLLRGGANFGTQSVPGGTKVTDVRLQLNAPAPKGGIKIPLNASQSVVQLDDAVAVTEGQTNSAPFSIGTSAVTSPTAVTLSSDGRVLGTLNVLPQ